MSRFLVLALTLISFTVAGTASATTFGGVGDESCLLGDVTANDTIGVRHADICIGRVSGNDSIGTGEPLLGILNDDDVFGNQNWIFKGKSDESAFNAEEEKSGTWSLLSGQASISGPFVLSFKHGSGWSAYFFADVFSVSDGLFSLPPSGQNNKVRALSHASLYIALGGPNEPTLVPQTSSLGLFITGLVLTLWSRRKRSFSASRVPQEAGRG